MLLQVTSTFLKEETGIEIPFIPCSTRQVVFNECNGFCCHAVRTLYISFCLFCRSPLLSATFGMCYPNSLKVIASLPSFRHMSPSNISFFLILAGQRWNLRRRGKRQMNIIKKVFVLIVLLFVTDQNFFITIWLFFRGRLNALLWI